MGIYNFFKKEKDVVVEPTDTVSAHISNMENNESLRNCILEKKKIFEICPQYISRSYYFDNRTYMYANNLAVEFSTTIIKLLFGFDEKLFNNCLLFSELENTKKVNGAFAHLWNAAFSIHTKNIFDDKKMAYNSVFNYQTGKVLVQKAKQLIVRKTIYGNTVEIVFKSCMPTQGFPNFEGYADFDFITALSILLIKEDYPDIQTVKANIYFGGGIYLNNLAFPVKVESTLDQRYIYGLINSR